MPEKKLDGLLPHRSQDTMFRQTTLENGLQIVAEIHPEGYTASFGYFVRTGARDETDAMAGVSHFLEHMMFKGTARRSAADVNRELDELGGQSNAYTSEEQTVYYATVLPKYQDRIVDLLSDLMRPSLRTEDFETERKVIIEEIAKYEDQPPFGAFERSMADFFPGHGLGRRILGTEQTILAMTPDQMRDYFVANYGPQSMVFAAAGRLDFDRLVIDLQQRTASWRPMERRAARVAPAAAESTHAEISIAEIAQAYSIRVGRAPSACDMDRYPMRLASTILGDESGSRIYWELVDTGLAEMAVTWTQEFDDCGVLFHYLVCHPDDMESNLAQVNEIIDRMQEGGVEEEELEQAINKTTAALVLQSERPSNRLFSIGNTWMLRGVYDPLDEVLDRYRRVTREDIYRVLERYPLRPSTQVLTKPT